MAKFSGIPLPKNVKDIRGVRFTRWVVKAFAGINKHRQSTWLCVCSCPLKTEKVVGVCNLKNGKSKSCGCLYKETRATCAATHGGCYEEEYLCWSGMMKRCYNPKHKSYCRYGAIGITVYKEWHEYRAFKDYVAKHLGPRPSMDHTIDRYPNRAGNYEPGNLRWATRKEQSRNTKSNVILNHDGKSVCIAEWTELKKWPRNKLKGRLYAGWSVERALDTP